MKLSNSAKDMFVSCPRKYYYHYIERLRSEKIPSPLFFGSALDEAFSHLLVTKKRELTDLELDQQLNFTAEEMFRSKMLKVESNGQEVELAKSPFADYYNSDFSPELLLPEHLPGLQEFEPGYKLVDFLDFHTQCKEQLRAKKKLMKDDQILYNYLTWVTLCEKGLLMVDAYRQDILPQINEVFAIQKPISLKNESGDELTGLIDVVCDFTDNPGTRYTLDNKSSSEPYKEDSVEHSEQLATYCEAEQINTAAYAVVQKKVFKKKPQIRTQLIKSVIPEETFQKVFDIYEKVCYDIESEKFSHNWDSCFAFGRMCPYYKLCKYNKIDGLVKLPKRDK